LADTLQPSAVRIGLHRRVEVAFGIGGQVRLLAGLVVAGGTVVAYHLSVADSLQNLRLGAPASYLALVPLVLIWSAWEATRRYRGAPPPIRDRQLDVILGVPLLLVSLFLITVIPVTSGGADVRSRVGLAIASPPSCPPPNVASALYRRLDGCGDLVR
jgi:hypothetical protein